MTMIGIVIVLFLGQIGAGTPHVTPLDRLQAKVQVDPINGVSPQRLAGKYSNPPKEFHGGLSGDDLYLFPDGTYIYCEWADIEPLTVRDKGAWKLADGLVVLTSDRDVTWDPDTQLLVAKERAKTFRPATAAKAKAELMKQSWRPAYFRAGPR